MIEEIRYHHRTRCFAMEQRKRCDLSLLSFLRTQLGWSPSLPDKDRAAIAVQAASLVSCGERLAKEARKAEEKRKPIPEADTEEYREWAGVIEAALQARAPWDAVEANALKEMKRLAKGLPVWAAWAEGVPGIGEAGLAVIVGEAGDLANYPKKGHLWKRMGLALVDGVRQGGLSKNAAKEDWIEHGYNRQRRSRMWTIGDSMIKAQGPYREIYLARKEYERKRAEAEGLIVAPSAKIPKARASEFISDGHIHRRAQRYMEKQFLRDLCIAWRRATPRVPHSEATLGLPAENQKAA